MIALLTVWSGLLGSTPARADRPAPSAGSVTDGFGRTTVAGCDTGGLRPGTTTRTTRIGGVARSYRVHVPAGYTGRTPYPLIVAYHGHAERSASFARYTGLSALPAIVVYPDGLRGPDGMLSWQGAPYSSPKADDVAFTAAILRDLRASGCVDRGRTFAVGRSNGGGFAAMLACRLPGTFAAIGVVDAALYNRAPNRCPAAPPTSVIAFHGTADRVIGYGGGMRQGQRYLPVMEWLGSWVRANACLPAPLVVPVNRAVDRFDWALCGDLGTQVTHYRIRGGGHVWPGGSGQRGVSDSIAATSLIWRFFERHGRGFGSIGGSS
ncbi:PHB depolymerase family esterase [Gordonia sinesedis]